MPIFPDVRIETTRLVLRAFRLDDAVSVGEVIEAGEREAMPPGAPDTRDALIGWLKEEAHRPRVDGSGLHLAMEHRTNHSHIGAISLFRTDWAARSSEVGYGVRARHRRLGYATEALLALTQWALSDGRMQRVELHANTDNRPSLRVAEKAGFIHEGILRRAHVEDDGLHDLAVFSRLDDDPAPASQRLT